MDFEKYKLLTILNYPVSDSLFKEKIGTGEELRELVKTKVLIDNQNEYFCVNFDSPEIKEMVLQADINLLHQDIINSYYATNIDRNVNFDYVTFIDKYRDYINLSFHHKSLGNNNDAVKCIFYIAKKLVYWGLGDLLVEELEKYTIDDVDRENYLWKQFYLFFYQLMHPSKSIEVNEFLKFVSTIESESYSNNKELYFETKNLEGIFYNSVKNDTLRAIEIFDKLIKTLEKYNDLNKELKLIYARLIENYAICKYGSDFCVLDKELDKVEEIFAESKDFYELCKLHYFKALVLQNVEDTENVILVQEFDRIDTILDEHAFPDLERNFYNLLSNFTFKETSSLEHYLKFKIEVLTRDLVLYFNYFMNDWIDILNKIENRYQNEDSEIVNNLEPLINFLTEIGLDDELLFINGVILFLQGKSEVSEFEKIENQDLRSFAYEYVDILKNYDNH